VIQAEAHQIRKKKQIRGNNFMPEPEKQVAARERSFSGSYRSTLLVSVCGASGYHDSKISFDLNDKNG
jgi:hypothetical protein